MSDPNYPIMELEAKLEESKDEVIKLQKVVIEKLQEEVNYLKGLLNWHKDEKDPGSHMIAPPVITGLKPRVRTTSEVSVLLERRSANAANALKELDTNVE